VRRALRLANNQEPVDELDAVVGLEQPALHETLVLDAAQAAGRNRRRRPHDVITLRMADAAGQRLQFHMR